MDFPRRATIDGKIEKNMKFWTFWGWGAWGSTLGGQKAAPCGPFVFPVVLLWVACCFFVHFCFIHFFVTRSGHVFRQARRKNAPTKKKREASEWAGGRVRDRCVGAPASTSMCVVVRYVAAGLAELWCVVSFFKAAYFLRTARYTSIFSTPSVLSPWPNRAHILTEPSQNHTSLYSNHCK